ncbi:Lia1p [Sugiyamaella lignohabitans]|uniref:Deoxyhypusine hydroxylase n=1 Tax=Sugiyamaella lignohabitans TaxID=796027 RepID=A0A167EQG7_9ASCO|nr:Lia1p [Sugiyamaella lignohabitans]ANB14346.1 Lia1p [Sugiyamaella lignohabitans]
MDELRQANGDSGSLDGLRATLLNLDGKTPLANRFRALFHLKSLGSEGNKQAIDIIAEGFKDPSELLKHELAYVLGQTKQLHAINPLVETLKNREQQAMVRHEAAEALGAIGDDSVLSILEDYYKNDPLEVIRQTCELAIERIKWEHSQAKNTEDLETSAFSSIDPAPPLPKDQQQVAKLRALLNNQEEPLFQRYRAMFRLRDIGTLEAVEALASGFDDSSALFRHEIAYVFGQLCDPASVPALIKVLNNEKEESMVRHEAAEALGSIATDEVLPVLSKFAKDNETVVRQSAEVALDMYEFENSDQVDYTLIPTQ